MRQILPTKRHHLKLQENEVGKAFNKLGLNLEKAIRQKDKLLQNMGVSSISSSLHYEIVAGISQHYSPMRILEIGTHDGFFTRYLANLFKESQITTLDLPINEDSKTVAEVHKVQNKNYGDNQKARSMNLDNLSNVTQLLHDSTHLTWSSSKYDLIWIDGDHTFPVVAFDIINSARLVSKNGWILLDDIKFAQTGRKSNMGNDQGYLSVKHLKELGIVDVTLIPKRIESTQKYIAVMKRRNDFSKL